MGDAMVFRGLVAISFLWLLTVTAIADVSVAQAVKQKRVEIVSVGVIANFVRTLSARRYEAAVTLLHPKLREAWTVDRFANDWRDIRMQAGAEWAPEVISTYSGTSAQGAYNQATFRLCLTSAPMGQNSRV